MKPLLADIQIINENNKPRFAVMNYNEYKTIQAILTDEEKLEDYLDYLHIQKVKAISKKSSSLEDVKRQLNL